MVLYASGSDGAPVKITVDTFRPLFFVPHHLPQEETMQAAERRPLPLRAMSDRLPVDCLYFRTYAGLLACRRNLRNRGAAVYESDIHPVERYLMERMVAGGFEAEGIWAGQGGILHCRNPLIRGAPTQPILSVLSIDIETDAEQGTILSIACRGDRPCVFMQGKGTDSPPVYFCGDERELLLRFFNHLHEEDPDIIIGWNVIDFDLQTIQDRCDFFHIPFDAGRDGGARIITGHSGARKSAHIPGRAIIDVPSMLRAGFHTFEEYSLDFVAGAMLGQGKSIRLSGKDKIREIIRRFTEEPLSLAEYNLRDADLTLQIFDRAGLLPNAIERSKHSGLLIDHFGGSIAAFDYLYLPRLHRAGYVAIDVADIAPPSVSLPGGFIVDPKPGLYENVLVFDFRSLYPSIIITFCIDPLGRISPSHNRVQGPVGPSFATDATILPPIIADLMEARSRAKRDRNPYLSQAIKILMNSFYGVLGSPGCRFFSPDIASAITGIGQYILKQTIEYIHSSTGFTVIYGDTDSLFVCLGGGGLGDPPGTAGPDIARRATEWLSGFLKDRFGVTSKLELLFERHFRHFFLPPLRGSTEGSKKHYCGSIVDASGEMTLLFKGMESARSDWTDLAKEFQYELFFRFFNGRPIDEFIRSTVEKVRQGKADDKLIYRKRLRKPIADYVDHLPPHVQAAKLLDSPGRVIRYCITTAGPQPIEHLTAPLDREHYIESQLQPIADSLLEWLGSGFDRILSGQQELQL
jgi:DNA polymerase-2